MTSRNRFLVRRATIRDVETLVHQRRRMWEDMGAKDPRALGQADKVYRRWAEKGLRNRTLLGWVAENKEGIVVGGGCVWLQPIQPRPGHSMGTQPYLLSMFTEPGFRGKGVASRIVRAAIEWTRKNGHHSLRLHASKKGRGVYRNLGFKRTWEMRLDFEP